MFFGFFKKLGILKLRNYKRGDPSVLKNFLAQILYKFNV